jgi:hypothetical protein
MVATLFQCSTEQFPVLSGLRLFFASRLSLPQLTKIDDVSGHSAQRTPPSTNDATTSKGGFALEQ